MEHFKDKTKHSMRNGFKNNKYIALCHIVVFRNTTLKSDGKSHLVRLTLYVNVYMPMF